MSLAGNQEYGTRPDPTFTNENGRLGFRFDAETLFIEPWGENAFRVRATCLATLPEREWALSEKLAVPKSDIRIGDGTASITNGKIKADISRRGKIVISNTITGKVLLEEYGRHRLDILDPKCSSLRIQAREWKPRLGSADYHLTMRFESQDRNERIYGMGQYQQPFLNLKGADLELAQRNSQATVPFALSSLGYGFLWNNPGIGRAVFSSLTTTFEAYSTDTLDYWVIAGDTPAEIVRGYTGATGRVPKMPEYGLGFWQCKLRYQTQEELLEVAREHKRRNLPLDLIVCDYFHWPTQGDWKFDPTFWPDPDAMVAELKSLNVELMVSVWPTVEKGSDNYDEMLRRGLLIRQDRGIRASMEGRGYPVHYDATNPEARKFVWDAVKRNYYSKGIKAFWLDEAEPEYTVYDFDIYRYAAGPNLSVGNIYPHDYAKGFYEGMKESGQEEIVNLVRCAWAGSQKYGALVWSGDIASSWGSLRNQLAAGLNMGIAGFAWFTTDIGGFHGGIPDDPVFRELFVRWFQWGTFCPVMRLHGDREPKQPRLGTTGGSFCLSGGPNEVWSYGEEVYKICEKYLRLREEMRDYTRTLMETAHEVGDPIIRPCFFDFPDDDKCWQLEDQYMYGPRYLVAPILHPGQKTREVYLPGEGAKWKSTDGTVYDGGRTVTVDSPLDTMPVFVR
ncbi:putative family 31 glucosidase ORF2 [Neonectria ditissima]|uniref:Putative family 31 glucosidase ORF2 n=1 Tax=Neonectria ditissima TaxID=78410 RepID=A0A0P7B6A1_9HYPO|nr:putative family 31 glucosidase ORF2 [Neonectria ditissima]